MARKSKAEQIEEEEIFEEEEAEEDAYEDEEYEEEGRSSRLIPTVIMVAALGGFVSLAWYAYHAGTGSVNKDELTLVEADKTPMKEKPLNPGGMKFPHQDKTIFNAVSNGGATATPERVAPVPEEPVSREQLAGAAASGEPSTWVNPQVAQAPAAEPKEPAATATENVALKPVQPAVPSAAAPVQPITSQPSAPVTAQSNGQPASAAPAAVELAEKETPAPVAKKEPVKAAAPASAPVKKEAPKPVAAGSGTIQLGAFKSEAEARAEWSKMTRKAPELSGLSPNVLRADLGAKGVFYRLRASVADAKSTCASLSAKGQACIVVK